MNLELFIAKRIIGSKTYKSSVSAPIIKIGIAAITIGMVVMLIAIATGIGLQQVIRDKIVAFNGHIIITHFDSNNSDETYIPISKNETIYKNYKDIKGINYLQSSTTKFAVIRTEKDFEGIIIKGVDEKYRWKYFKNFLVQGRLPNYKKERNNEVLLSQHIANRLNLKLNDNFQVLFGKNLQKLPRIMSFKIVGIYNSGFQEFDEKICLADQRHLQRINKWEEDQVGQFEIFINDFEALDQVSNKVYNYASYNLNTKSVTNKYPHIFEWISIFDQNTLLIIVIMIIVAGINMITALLVLILERTNMIGLLKALGATNLSIRKIFLYNAAYLIGLGLLWGNIIGLGLLFAQKYFQLLKFPNPKDYHISVIPVHLSLDYIVLLNIGTFITCLLMLYIPSIIISKINPVKAIRFN